MIDLKRRRYRVDSNAWFATVEGRAIVVDPNTQTYLALSDSATVIWERLQEGLSVSEIEEAVMVVFDGDARTIGEDVRAFLADLEVRGLIREER